MKRDASGTFRREDFVPQLARFSAALAASRAPSSYAAAEGEAGSEAALLRAIERLEEQQEELSVAEEELRAQLDELHQEARRAELENERYRMLFDFCPDALFVTDALGVIREANTAAGDLIEIDNRFLHGKPLAIFIGGAGAVAFRTLLSSFPRDEVSEVSVQIHTRRHRQIRVIMRGAPIVGSDTILWSARGPIVERHPSTPPPMSEGNFARVVAERTGELRCSLERAETRLREERDRGDSLRRANDAKDQSLAVISHELRAPVQAILGWTSLLRDGLEDAQRERALQIIELNARAQAELIENLFEHSRIVANKPVVKAPVDLIAVVQLSVQSMKPHADVAAVTISCSTAADLWVAGEVFGLQRVMTNLLANAIRHAGRGGRVTVDVSSESGLAVISVTDDGEGIAPELLERVFDRFEQAQRRAGSGLGLGLFLVRALVRRLDGTVQAFSDGPGKGTRFVVTIPQLLR